MDIQGRKFLVTGGAGFIGSHLVDWLLRLGCEVVAYDNFDDFYAGKEKNLEQNLANKKFRLVRGSILDAAQLEAAMEGATVVFHLAAQAGVRYCMSFPLKAHETNVTGTLNVLMAAKRLGVKKVIYASSSSVYGNPIKVPLSEDHPLFPTNIYGASKLAAEKYCLALHASGGVPVTCLRYFSVYGPRGRPDQVIYSFARKILDGKKPVIYGKGSQTRDFTFVSDIVSATIFSVLNDESDGEVLNIGYGKEFAITEVAEIIARRLGKKLEVQFEEGYKGDFPRTLCNNTRAKRVLRWSPRVGLEEGLEEFLDWFTTVQPQNSKDN